MLIENTAGGDNAVARRFDALARLWDAIGELDTAFELGFCFDTCHAHAAGEDLSDAVERALAIVGRIDLLHVNDSRDPAGTGADRHANLGKGEIGAETLEAMIRAAGPPAIVETPGDLDDMRADIEFVRAAPRGLAPEPPGQRRRARARGRRSLRARRRARRRPRGRACRPGSRS